MSEDKKDQVVGKTKEVTGKITGDKKRENQRKRKK